MLSTNNEYGTWNSYRATAVNANFSPELLLCTSYSAGAGHFWKPEECYGDLLFRTDTAPGLREGLDASTSSRFTDGFVAQQLLQDRPMNKKKNKRDKHSYKYYYDDDEGEAGGSYSKPIWEGTGAASQFNGGVDDEGAHDYAGVDPGTGVGSGGTYADVGGAGAGGDTYADAFGVGAGAFKPYADHTGTGAGGGGGSYADVGGAGRAAKSGAFSSTLKRAGAEGVSGGIPHAAPGSSIASVVAGGK